MWRGKDFHLLIYRTKGKGICIVDLHHLIGRITPLTRPLIIIHTQR